MKYVCDVCGWEYDEELGYPKAALPPAPSGRKFPTILNAPCAVWTRSSTLRSNA